MRWNGFVLSATLALVAFAAEPAFADGKQIGQTFFNLGSQSANTDAIAFFDVDPPDEKAAGLIAAVYGADSSQPPEKLLIGFYDKAAWAKFVALWNKARHAKRPTEAEVYSDKSSVGSYFDAADNTLLTLSLSTEGDIDFVLAGKPDANNSPSVLGYIELVHGDFKAFDRNVRTISTYFAK